MARRSSARRIVAEVPILLDEAELERVRSIYARVWRARDRPWVSDLARLARQLMLKGCEVLERLPIDGEPSFLSEDDFQRALHARVEERQARDSQRAELLEGAP